MIVKMFILLYSRSMMIACGVLARRKFIASFLHRWLGSTEASKYKSLLSPPPISPIAAPSEEQKEHEDNENEIHIFLQHIWREISLLQLRKPGDVEASGLGPSSLE
jgi:hypothetical protein